MKKQKVLYMSLSVGCILQLFTVFTMLIITPVLLLPATVIACLSGVVTTAVLFLLFQKLEPQHNEPVASPILPQYTQNQDIDMLIYDLKKELQNYKGEAIEVYTENENLRSALKEKKAEIEKLKKTARQMQGWIESFPYEINPQFKLYSLFETEVITGSYSRWLVSGEENGMLFAFELIRSDSQNKIELFQMLQKLQTKEDIIKLDMAKEKFNPEFQAA